MSEKHEIQRLYCMENAFINYDGGVQSIIDKSIICSEALKYKNPEASQILQDISHYLNAVINAGHIDIYQHQSLNKKNKLAELKLSLEK